MCGYDGSGNIIAFPTLHRSGGTRGVGFGEYGDGHVRFALIENEERTRQAVRGIKDMLRKDGLL